MDNKIKLNDYQQKAFDNIDSSSVATEILYNIPTGAGKTFLLAYLISNGYGNYIVLSSAAEQTLSDFQKQMSKDKTIFIYDKKPSDEEITKFMDYAISDILKNKEDTRFYDFISCIDKIINYDIKYRDLCLKKIKNTKITIKNERDNYSLDVLSLNKIPNDASNTKSQTTEINTDIINKCLYYAESNSVIPLYKAESYADECENNATYLRNNKDSILKDIKSGSEDKIRSINSRFQKIFNNNIILVDEAHSVSNKDIERIRKSYKEIIELGKVFLSSIDTQLKTKDTRRVYLGCVKNTIADKKETKIFLFTGTPTGKMKDGSKSAASYAFDNRNDNNYYEVTTRDIADGMGYFSTKMGIVHLDKENDHKQNALNVFKKRMGEYGTFFHGLSKGDQMPDADTKKFGIAQLLDNSVFHAGLSSGMFIEQNVDSAYYKELAYLLNNPAKALTQQDPKNKNQTIADYLKGREKKERNKCLKQLLGIAPINELNIEGGVGDNTKRIKYAEKRDDGLWYLKKQYLQDVCDDEELINNYGNDNYNLSEKLLQRHNNFFNDNYDLPKKQVEYNNQTSRLMKTSDYLKNQTDKARANYFLYRLHIMIADKTGDKAESNKKLINDAVSVKGYHNGYAMDCLPKIEITDDKKENIKKEILSELQKAFSGIPDINPQDITQHFHKHIDAILGIKKEDVAKDKVSSGPKIQENDDDDIVTYGTQKEKFIDLRNDILYNLNDIPSVLDDTKTEPEFVTDRMKYGVNLFNINKCLGVGFDGSLAMIFGYGGGSDNGQSGDQIMGRGTRGLGDKYPRYQYGLSYERGAQIKNGMVRYILDVEKHIIDKKENFDKSQKEIKELKEKKLTLEKSKLLAENKIKQLEKYKEYDYSQADLLRIISTLEFEQKISVKQRVDIRIGELRKTKKITPQDRTNLYNQECKSYDYLKNQLKDLKEYVKTNNITLPDNIEKGDTKEEDKNIETEHTKKLNEAEKELKTIKNNINDNDKKIINKEKCISEIKAINRHKNFTNKPFYAPYGTMEPKQRKTDIIKDSSIELSDLRELLTFFNNGSANKALKELPRFENHSEVINTFQKQIYNLDLATYVYTDFPSKEFYKNLFLYPDLVSKAMDTIKNTEDNNITSFFNNVAKIKNKKEFEHLIGIYNIDFSSENQINDHLKKSRIVKLPFKY